LKKVGILGCGAIGTQFALAIDDAKVGDTTLVFLFDMNKAAAEGLASKLRNSNIGCFSDFSNLISSSEFKACNIVLESASQSAVRLFGRRLLDLGKDLIIMSVGALVDDRLYSELLTSLEKNHANLSLPTGAIAGIDAIRSIRNVLDSVLLITTKNPKALEGAPFFEKSGIKLESITQKTVLFQGSAADAIVNFPLNVNVSSLLALAGIGMNRTMVRIIADPMLHQNQHQIIAKGSFGMLNIKLRNNQAPGNPKTSFLAILSAIESVRSSASKNFRIGT
jgi:aspartate dehydrogenase